MHCVSENNYCHPFWPRFNVSIICTICIDVPETDRLFVELGHMLEYHLATAHLVANHPVVHSGPLHTYPGIVWIRNYLFPDSKISTSTRIHFEIEFTRTHCSAQGSSRNTGNRARVVKTGKSRVKSNRENLGKRLPSWIQYSW